MSYRKYNSRMSQRYLNQNLIVSKFDLRFFENRATGFEQSHFTICHGVVAESLIDDI